MNKQIKKALALLLAAGMLAGMLAGCGKDDPKPKKKKPHKETEETTVYEEPTDEEEDLSIELEDTIWYDDDSMQLLQFFNDGTLILSNPAGGEAMDGVYSWYGTDGSAAIEDWEAEFEYDGLFLSLETDGGRYDLFEQLDSLPPEYQDPIDPPEISILEGTAWGCDDIYYAFLPDGVVRVVTPDEDSYGIYEVYDDGTGIIEYLDKHQDFTPMDESIWISDEEVDLLVKPLDDDIYYYLTCEDGLADDGRELSEMLEGTCWKDEYLYLYFDEGHLLRAGDPDTGLEYLGSYYLDSLIPGGSDRGGIFEGAMTLDGQEAELYLSGSRLYYILDGEESIPEPEDPDFYMENFG